MLSACETLKKDINEGQIMYIQRKDLQLPPFLMSFTLKIHNFNEIRCVVSQAIFVVAIKNYYGTRKTEMSHHLLYHHIKRSKPNFLENVQK